MSDLEENLQEDYPSGDDDIYEDENGQKFKKCRGCNRPLIRHPGAVGPKNCTNTPLEGQELKDYIRNLREELRKEQSAPPATSGGPSAVTGGTPQQTTAGQSQATGMIDMKAVMEGIAAALVSSQATNMQATASAAAAAAARAVQEAQALAQGRTIPHYQMYQQLSVVPKFSKKMTVEAYVKRLKIWFDNHSQASEPLRMTWILDSLKDKDTEREELVEWVIYTIEDDPEFDLQRTGIFKEFIKKLQEKFDISNWEKSQNLWREILQFKAKEDEKTKEYLMRFQEMESRMRNLGNVIPDTFMAIHVLEQAIIPEHSKQSVISNIDLEDKKTVFKNVKKKMEQILPKVNPGEGSMTFWSNRQRGYEGPPNKRGTYWRGENYPEQNEREGRNYSSSGRSVDREERRTMQEAEELSQQTRGRSRGRSGSGYKGRGRSRSQGRQGGRRSQSRGRSGNRQDRGRSWNRQFDD